MQKLFDEIGSIDTRCYEQLHLSEDILMEHAANGMATFIAHKFAKKSTVIIVCGSGNNGADGCACARLLHGEYDVGIYYAKEPKSAMAKLQASRAKSIDVKILEELYESDVLVDALVGTGFSGELNAQLSVLMDIMNNSNAYKIACDVPSGYKFFADTTLSMGALKKDMYLDAHKDALGEVKVLNLGVTRNVYEAEGKSAYNLLEWVDMHLPNRDKDDAHKGTFGHLAIASGNKVGASVLSALSALRFGAGLVTLVGYEKEGIASSIMYSHELPRNTTALAIGMGLGDDFNDKELAKFLDNEYPIIIDADIFSMGIVKKFLKKRNVVLTPHPKEFVHLLKELDLLNISVEVLQKNRFKYVEMFHNAYPNATLLLKGANVIIADSGRYFVNAYGSAKLAKGGSGDVLSGLIGALLAQGYSPLDATISASLAHTKLAQNYEGADFSLTPDDLIDGISKL